MEPFVNLGISLGLGLLIGLERERTGSGFGGIRTFPLISLLGTFCGMISLGQSPWPIAAGLFSVFGILAISNWLNGQRKMEEGEHGQTTEVAALLTFALGAYLPYGNRSLCIVAAGLVVVLLHLKQPMHTFARKMGPKDMTGIIQFVVISMIILPILPDRNFGPLQVLNPFDIWRMVVLIVGLSLAGYILFKWVGEREGVLLAGLLGGLISSTATTVSYAKRARDQAAAHHAAIVIILVASTVSFCRVMFEITVIAPSHTRSLLPPLAVVLLGTAIVSLVALVFARQETSSMPEANNPAELKGALMFGAIYAGITLAVEWVKTEYGSSGLYLVSIISGLTDMDAITLSLSRMVESETLEASTAWRLILAAALSNFLFKGAAAAFLGGLRFGWKLAPYFAVILAGGLLLIFLWP